MQTHGERERAASSKSIPSVSCIYVPSSQEQHSTRVNGTAAHVLVRVYRTIRVQRACVCASVRYENVRSLFILLIVGGLYFKCYFGYFVCFDLRLCLLLLLLLCQRKLDGYKDIMYTYFYGMGIGTIKIGRACTPHDNEKSMYINNSKTSAHK